MEVTEQNQLLKKQLKVKLHQRQIQDYLETLENLELLENRVINPNFYTSLTYLRLSNAVCYERGFWIWVEADGWMVLPALPTGDWARIKYYPDLPVWSDFEGYEVFPKLLQKQFLDVEYIFDPKAFNDLSGGRWCAYRKNSRKWFKSQEKWVYEGVTRGDEGKLIGEWLETKGDTVLDGDFMLRYLLRDDREGGRKYLYDEKGELVALNAWDTNHRYVNYLFCITRPGVPYLEEFVRYLFYTDPEIQGTGKLVNDGGCLDNLGLRKFKEKLNPRSVRNVNSLIKTK